MSENPSSLIINSPCSASSNHDGRRLYPTQIFFPMADAGSGWGQLAKHLKAEIDEGLIESYKGTVSLPFQTGKNSRIAVKSSTTEASKERNLNNPMFCYLRQEEIELVSSRAAEFEMLRVIVVMDMN